jgi:hypothetical protein
MTWNRQDRHPETENIRRFIQTERNWISANLPGATLTIRVGILQTSLLIRFIDTTPAADRLAELRGRAQLADITIDVEQSNGPITIE